MASSRKVLLDLYRPKLLEIYFEGLNSISSEILISKNVRIDQNKLLIIKSDLKSPLSEINLQTNNVHIVSFGKSAVSLSKAIGHLIINSQYTKSFRDGFVIAPCHLEKRYNTDDCCKDIFQKLNLTCHFGAENNLPDEKSMLASDSLLEYIKTAVKEDIKQGLRSTFFVLFGGGGSACLTYPKFIDLKRKLELIRFLQRKGADIVELNQVRRFFSHVKGGQLAKYMLDQGDEVNVISLIVSDVVGNPLEFIASGPTYIPSDYDISASDLRKGMVGVIKKYQYDGMEDLLEQIDSKLSIKQDCIVTSKYNYRVKNLIIGDNSLAIESAAKRARDLGFAVHVIGNSWEGYAEDILDEIESHRQRVLNSKDKPILIIGGGEATIKSREGDTWGVGGRCQEMGLDYLINKLNDVDSNQDQDGIELFLAATTDGQDGPTDVAACLVSHSDALLASRSQNCDVDHKSILEKLKLKAIEAKRSHNSNKFWSENYPDSLINTGMTETNVMDLYMLMIANK